MPPAQNHRHRSLSALRRRAVLWWLTRVPSYQLVVALGGGGTLLAAALFGTMSGLLASPAKALNVLLGTASPFDYAHGPVQTTFAVVLAILGWLLVPTFTGAIVGAVISEMTEKSPQRAERYTAKLDAWITKELDRERRRAREESGGPQA